MGRAFTLSAMLAALLVGACGGSDSSGRDEAPDGTASAAPERGAPSKGGEASIEEFGEEAEGGKRAALLAAFDEYLRAIVAEDSATACSRLAATVRGSIERIGAEALPGKGCAAILPRLLAPGARQVAREQVEGEITKVRVEGESAFVVFRAPGAKLYQLAMVEEEGDWKAASVTAGILVPELGVEAGSS